MRRPPLPLPKMNMLFPNSLRLLLATALAACCWSPAFAQSKPKLVVVVSVDQLCYKYLDIYEGGFDEEGFFQTVGRDGASFTDCYHRHAFTFTAPGHSVMLTGAYPNRTGIIGNGWYDPDWGRDRYCVEDQTVRLVGLPDGEGGDPMSPRSLQAETLGDVMKRSTAGKAKVFGIAWKDRAGILMAGRRADAAYWFDTRCWVTSTYYREELPPYIRTWNESRVAQRYAGATWELLLPKDRYIAAREDDYEFESEAYGLGRAFPHTLAAADDPMFDKQLPLTPIGNQLTLEAAMMIIEFGGLGDDDVTDLLCIGLSSNDYAGHQYGPYSLEVQDMTFRTDQLLAQFIKQLDEQIGEGNWTLALTADHGVAPLPEFLPQVGIEATKRDPLGDKDLDEFHQLLEGKVRQALGEPPDLEAYVLEDEVNQVNLNRDPAVLAGQRLTQARAAVKAALKEIPEVHAAYTRDEILAAKSGDGRLMSHFQKAFHAERSGDVMFVLKPYTIQTKAAATHGSPWPYDTHVPLLLLGSGVKPGTYRTQCSPANLGPTLAKLLDVETPMHAVEGPLAEVLKP